MCKQTISVLINFPDWSEVETKSFTVDDAVNWEEQIAEIIHPYIFTKVGKPFKKWSSLVITVVNDDVVKEMHDG